MNIYKWKGYGTVLKFKYIHDQVYDYFIATTNFAIVFTSLKEEQIILYKTQE